jgi:hypothetical protein
VRDDRSPQLHPEGTAPHSVDVVRMGLPALVAVAVAFLLAAVTQQGLLDFFYWAVPGRKSSDGPIFVIFAYVLLLVVPPLLVAVGEWRGWRRPVAFTLAVASGPGLMAIAAAVCAWAARLSPS